MPKLEFIERLATQGLFVLMDGKRVGSVRKSKEGWRYYPHSGPAYPTLNAAKAAVEASVYTKTPDGIRRMRQELDESNEIAHSIANAAKQFLSEWYVDLMDVIAREHRRGNDKLPQSWSHLQGLIADRDRKAAEVLKGSLTHANFQ